MLWFLIIWVVNLFVSLDQLLNSICGGEPDNTISARIGFFAREMEYEAPFKNFKKRYWNIIETLVDFAWKPVSGSNHCLKAYLEDADEKYNDNNWWPFLIPMSLIIFVICIPLIVIFYLASFIGGLFRFKKGKTLQSKNKISVKVKARLIKGIKKFRNVLKESEQKGINKFDTNIIVVDMLGEMFGYHKYSEIGSDYDNKNIFCVLTLKIDDNYEFPIEVYPIEFKLGTDSNKQIANYRSNQGVDRVILTNGIEWKVFTKNNKQELNELVTFDFLNPDQKEPELIDKLYYVCKESLGKPVHEDHGAITDIE